MPPPFHFTLLAHNSATMSATCGSASCESDESSDDGGGKPQALPAAQIARAVVDLNKGTIVSLGHAQREDKFPLLKGWAWGGPPERLVTMADYALSSANAIRAVWKDSADDHVHGMCSVHASVLWFDNNKGLFNDAKKNRKLVIEDFERYKRSPFVSLVPVLLRLMLEKWGNKYKEKTLASKWSSQWATTTHTMIELNTFCESRGGIPSHNNHIEGSNNEDKARLGRIKQGMVSFIQTFAEDLSQKSLDDLRYQGTCVSLFYLISYLRVISTTHNIGRMHSDVHSNRFYHHCHAVLSQSLMKDDPKATFLTVIFPFTAKTLGFCDGTMLVASHSFVTEKWKNYLPPQNNAPTTAKEMLQLVQRNKLHDRYKSFVKNPVSFCSNMDFDDVCDWMKMFHILQPLAVSDATHHCISRLLMLLNENWRANHKPEVFLPDRNQGLLVLVL
jgi:hypothetical protein